MLFQPTNITPDYRGQLGNGTVEATEPLTVSWQVNGNSPMVAFQIVIYQNDAQSTQVFSTGKLTDGCPFYGIEWNGEVKYFSYTISNSGITNGNEYKLIITQWWGSGENDYVTQTSASAFLTRETPTFTINNVPETLDQRMFTFEADYEQGQGDGLNWIRWMVALAANRSDPLFDTQNIYGTAQLQVTYDGFFTGNRYAVRAMVQTVNGIDLDSGWQEFDVSYPTGILGGLLEISPVCNSDGARVSWNRIMYIPATVTGSATVADGHATIGDGASVKWDKENGSAIRFSKPWSFVYGGRTMPLYQTWKYSPAVDASLFTIETTTGIITAEFDAETQMYNLSFDGEELASIGEIPYDAKLTALIAPGHIYIRAEHKTFNGGLYPGETLYPSASLFPEEDRIVQSTVLRYDAETNADFGEILSVTIGGRQTADYVQVVMGEASADVINAVYTTGVYAPKYNPEHDYMTANFEVGFGGGNLDGISADGITGLSLYRKKSSADRLVHIADFELGRAAIMDYSLANINEPYSWYLFAQGETTYIAGSVESNRITPCFWDWIILEAEYDPTQKNYNLVREYKFGKNLSTSDISNSNTPGVFQNFTRYPMVQTSPQNYMSGSLTSLIGVIDYSRENNIGYRDTLELRDAIFALSTTRNALFLKSRKGDFMEIRISGAITMATMDESREQAQTATIPWVQIGDADADGISIIRTVNGG